MKSDTHRRLLASDLDGTMYPVGPDPTHAAALDGFAHLRAANGDLVVAYVTGRHLASAVEAMAFWSLPRPDLLSCDVGTSLYRPDSGEPSGWRRDEDYAALMAETMNGVTAPDIAHLLDGVSDLTPQPSERQSSFKISYLLPPDAAGDKVLMEVRRRLTAAGATFSVVRSSGVYEDDDLLDILPPGVTKTSAVAYMSTCPDTASGLTLYAGDSRNDLDPLLACDGGIVVANARPALLEALREAPDSVYMAARPHLHGVVEGALHFGLKTGEHETPKGDG
jgi:HAD superfamily hydrolase (TIGR01484 family)